jgi:molybdopterin-containing oxidoreductase family membrane subunit
MYKKMRAAHGDDVKHYSPSVIPRKPNTAALSNKKQDDRHNEMVNSDSLIDTEVKKGQLDSLLLRLGAFDPNSERADNLKKISGVGPVMEKKLHQLGIFTFLQVSKMEASDYDLLDEIIGEFPGRAKRDDWAGQASKLKNN